MTLVEFLTINKRGLADTLLVFILKLPFLHFQPLLRVFPTCGFYMIFTFLCFPSPHSKFYFRDEPKRERQKNSNIKMEGQLIIQTRPESPVRAIITTSSYNSSQQMSAQQHSVVVSSNSVLRNTNESGKNRICRDFVRGSCRRLYCRFPHVQSNDLVVFCHDFQNNKCPRINCK